MYIKKNIILNEEDCNIIKNFYHFMFNVCNEIREEDDNYCNNCPFEKMCTNTQYSIERFKSIFSTDKVKIDIEE